MHDRRKVPRVHILKPGKILLGNSELACTVRNFSTNGACLVVQTTFGLPALFQLVMANEAPKNCKVIWRDETFLGISFR